MKLIVKLLVFHVQGERSKISSNDYMEIIDIVLIIYLGLQKIDLLCHHVLKRSLRVVAYVTANECKVITSKFL